MTAHPDDVDFGFAGIGRAGSPTPASRSSYCIVTDGDAGGAETGHAARRDGAACAARSRRAAAAVVGVHELHFLGYPDGRVEPTLDLRRDISRVIRTVRPTGC